MAVQRQGRYLHNGMPVVLFADVLKFKHADENGMEKNRIVDFDERSDSAAVLAERTKQSIIFN